MKLKRNLFAAALTGLTALLFAPPSAEAQSDETGQRLSALNQRVERLIGLAQSRQSAPAQGLSQAHRQQLNSLEQQVNLLESLLAARAGSGPEALAARRGKTTKPAPSHGGGGSFTALSVDDVVVDATSGFGTYIVEEDGEVLIHCNGADGGTGIQLNGDIHYGGTGYQITARYNVVAGQELLWRVGEKGQSAVHNPSMSLGGGGGGSSGVYRAAGSSGSSSTHLVLAGGGGGAAGATYGRRGELTVDPPQSGGAGATGAGGGGGASGSADGGDSYLAGGGKMFTWDDTGAGGSAFDTAGEGGAGYSGGGGAAYGGGGGGGFRAGNGGLLQSPADGGYSHINSEGVTITSMPGVHGGAAEPSNGSIKIILK